MRPSRIPALVFVGARGRGPAPRGLEPAGRREREAVAVGVLVPTVVDAVPHARVDAVVLDVLVEVRGLERPVLAAPAEAEREDAAVVSPLSIAMVRNAVFTLLL